MCFMRNKYPLLKQLKFYFGSSLFAIRSVAFDQEKITGIVLNDNNLLLSRANPYLVDGDIEVTIRDNEKVILQKILNKICELFFYH